MTDVSMVKQNIIIELLMVKLFSFTTTTQLCYDTYCNTNTIHFNLINDSQISPSHPQPRKPFFSPYSEDDGHGDPNGEIFPFYLASGDVLCFATRRYRAPPYDPTQSFQASPASEPDTPSMRVGLQRQRCVGSSKLELKKLCQVTSS